MTHSLKCSAKWARTGDGDSIFTLAGMVLHKAFSVRTFVWRSGLPI